MGCFNVVCAVTRTPIIAGEKIRVIVLENPDIDGLIDGESTRFILRSSFKESVVGLYNDYGGVEGFEPVDKWNQEGDLRAWFFSEAAWQYGEKIVKNKEYQWIDEFMSDYGINGLLEKIAGMDTFKDDERFKGELTRIAAEKVKQPIIKVAVALNSFCRRNCINLFDPAFCATYGGQGIDLEVMSEWEKLRKARTKTLTKIKESWK